MLFSKKSNINKNLTVTWHAGAMNTVDNTLDSLKTALDSNADIAELDLSFLPDNAPVIIHSENPTDVSLPKFEDALRLTSEYKKTSINIDIKSVANIKGVDELVKKYGLENRAFFTGVTAEWTAEVKKASTLPYYLNIYPDMAQKHCPKKAEELVKSASEMGCVGINTYFKNMTKVLSKAALKYNMAVSLWTPSTEAEIKSALKYSPDNITSRRPDIVYKVIGR